MKKINQEESSEKNAVKPLTAIVLLATLKPKNQLSHTAVLATLLMEKLARSNIQSEMIRLIDYDIKPGIQENMGTGDEWPKILKQMSPSQKLSLKISLPIKNIRKFTFGYFF